MHTCRCTRPNGAGPCVFLGDFKQHWYTGATEHSAFCLSQRLLDIGSPRGLRRFSRMGASVAFGHLGTWNSPGRFQQYSRAGPAMRFSRSIICPLYRTDKYCQTKHRSPLLIVTYLPILSLSWSRGTMPLLDFPLKPRKWLTASDHNIQSDLVDGLRAPSTIELMVLALPIPSRERHARNLQLIGDQSNHSEAREATKSFVCLGGSIKSALSRSFELLLTPKERLRTRKSTCAQFPLFLFVHCRISTPRPPRVRTRISPITQKSNKRLCVCQHLPHAISGRHFYSRGFPSFWSRAGRPELKPLESWLIVSHHPPQQPHLRSVRTDRTRPEQFRSGGVATGWGVVSQSG